MNLRFLIALTWLALAGTPLAAQTPSSFEIAAKSSGVPEIPGLNIVWLTPWGRLELAREWKNIVVHQSEGGPGTALREAFHQMDKPDRRGVSVWVETDGTVYWPIVEFAVPHHVRANRVDNKYIDNSVTAGQVTDDNSIGIEFVGNAPNVRKPVTEAQMAAWRILVRVLMTRYNIPADRVYAHNWIDYKDRRYCEGCQLAIVARTQGMQLALEKK
jgi:hypothetical protein